MPEKAEEVSVETNNEKPICRIREKARNPNLALRHVYPEFLPDPNPKWRNTLREKLERADMLKRRNNIDIPEFYVGEFMLIIQNISYQYKN